jgi:hypothetical protein
MQAYKHKCQLSSQHKDTNAAQKQNTKQAEQKQFGRENATKIKYWDKNPRP